MSLTVQFSTSQVIGAPSQIVIVDETTGTDVTAVNRRLALVTATGQYLTENGLFDTATYINWPIADGLTRTLDVLTADAALDTTLQYLTVANAVVAEDTSLEGFTLFNESFYYSLTQAQASQNQPPPMIIQDSNYFLNKLTLRTLIDSGNNAIVYGEDITTAQSMYDQASYMVSQQNNFF